MKIGNYFNLRQSEKQIKRQRSLLYLDCFQDLAIVATEVTGISVISDIQVTPKKKKKKNQRFWLFVTNEIHYKIEHNGFTHHASGLHYESSAEFY